MPKRKIFSEVVSRAVDWQAVDAREEADGEVDDVRRLARLSRCEFIDGRVTDRLVCPECAAQIDLADHFRNQLVKV
jgi:hypothetical protein